jgi:hypothetical protein
VNCHGQLEGKAQDRASVMPSWKGYILGQKDGIISAIVTWATTETCHFMMIIEKVQGSANGQLVTTTL